MLRHFALSRRGRTGRSVPSQSRKRAQARRPAVEGLEGRTLLAVDFTQSWGIGGQDISVQAAQTDSAGNRVVTGYFSGTVDFDPSSGVSRLTSHGGRDIFLAKYSDSGNLLWAKNYGGSGDDVANDLAIDDSGNLYIAGQFSGTTNIDGNSLTSRGNSDMFVAKLASNGQVNWVTSAGGGAYDLANAVTVDSSGNVIVTGQYTGSAKFDNTTLAGFGSYDVFVAKYGPSGNFQWAQAEGGGSLDLSSGVATDPSGNVYITGSYMGTANYGGDRLSNGGSYDAFIAKISASGDDQWGLSLDGPGSNLGRDIDVDGKGNVYIAGQFTEDATIGGKNISSGGLIDAFAAKVSPSGSVAWAQDFGGPSNVIANRISVDPDTGNSVIAGQFMGNASFGATTLTSFGQYDTFVAKLDSTGGTFWAASAGGSSSDGANAVQIVASGDVSVAGYYAGPANFGSSTLANLGTQNFYVTDLQESSGSGSGSGSGSHDVGWVEGIGGGDLQAKAVKTDSAGNTYVAGYFSGKVDFDPSAGTTWLSSHGGRDMFLAKYSPKGDLLWANNYGGSSDDLANDLAIDDSGNLYLAGQFNGTINLGGTSLRSTGSSDAVVVKLDSSGNVVWADSGGGSGFDLGTAITVDGSGNVILAGQYSGAARFDGTTLGSIGSYDVFVAKYGPGGDLKWATAEGGKSVDLNAGVTTDSSGNIYISGSYIGAATYGGTDLSNKGVYDAYLAKLDGSGKDLWGVNVDGSGSILGRGVAVDGDGNAYITGQFAGKATFGGKSITSSSLIDAFAAKVSPNGSVAWLQDFGGTSNVMGMAIAVNKTTGDATIAGQFIGDASFGSTTLSSFGQYDSFVTRLDSSGNILWAKGDGGASSDGATAVAVDDSGGYRTVGYYVGPANFGTHVLSNLGTQNFFAVIATDPKKN